MIQEHLSPGSTRAAGLFVAAAVAALLGAACGSPSREMSAPSLEEVPVDSQSISGIVLNGETPEAGVWVIAETGDLASPYQKIVVTDDGGRFLVPELPAVDYQVWVRGYGLRDSAPIAAAPGDRLTLLATEARTSQEAARIYPASYWLSLYEPPPAGVLPLVREGDSPDAWNGGGEGEPVERSDEESSLPAGAYPTRGHWVAQMKLGCMLCHQMGQDISRLFPEEEHWDAVWTRAAMDRTADGLGREALRASLADWGARIEAGDVPPAPPRPSGVERNIVITSWEWGLENSYIHDNVSTDKRTPTLYPYGSVWGLDIGQSYLWELDPQTHEVTAHAIPLRDGPGRDPDRLGRIQGNTSSHNPMLDDQGNVWMTTRVRDYSATPAWAPARTVDIADSGKPLGPEASRSSRQLGYFDSTRDEFVLVDTAYATHHLQFDGEGRLWTSGDGSRLGVLDPSKLDPANLEETEAEAQTAWAKIDPETGRSVMGGGYGIIVNPVDGTVWRAGYPGIFGQPPLPSMIGNRIDKFDPKTQEYTQYILPPPAYGPRGIDATTDGHLWFATGSGHLGRFDPKTEEFTYWETPGPTMQGVDGDDSGGADFHYYIWVDQFNTLGLGDDRVIVTGTNSDSLIVFDPAAEDFTVIRVPYPRGMFTRGLDGRIDDPEAGWKGRGLWVSNNTDGLVHTEDRTGFISHVQFRPDPLAP